MSKVKRSKKEKAIKTAMAGCLQERGFVVQGWTKTSKAEATRTASPANGAPPPKN